jgi:hypothetical protein
MQDSRIIKGFIAPIILCIWHITLQYGHSLCILRTYHTVIKIVN